MTPRFFKASLLCGALALGGWALSMTPHTVLAERAAGAQQAADYASSLYDAASKARIERKGWEVDGRQLRVIKMTKAGVTLRDDRRAEDIESAWTDLPLRWQDDLLTRGKARSADNLVELARAAKDAGRTVMAARLLGEAVKESSAATDAATVLLSGYQLHDDMFVPAGLNADELADLLEDLEKNAGRTGREQSKRQDETFREVLVKLANLDEFSREAAVEVLARLRTEELAGAEEATGLSKDLEKLVAEKAALEKARAHALELIEDEVNWPYPYGVMNDAVTADVLRRVAEVRKLWDAGTELKGKKASKPEVAFVRIAMLQSAIDMLDPAGNWDTPVGEDYVAYVKALTNQPLSVKNFASSPEQMGQIAWNREVADSNAAVADEFKKDSAAPDAQAWEQLQVTNDYREMMGRHCLKMNFKLYWAAKHHSDYCATDNHGQIAHVIPGEPRGEGPGERAAHEGYTGLWGENICFVPGNTPLKAHNGWLESSGHHRNILNAHWRVMGNGRSGAIWTQVFGDTDEGNANNESKGGE